MLDDLEVAEIFACRSVRRPAKKGRKPRYIGKRCLATALHLMS